MREIFKEELIKLARKKKNLMLLTGDLGYGVFNKFEKKYPKKYLNVGVAEQNLIGISSGLAKEGKCVICYSIANFLTLRCLEQIRNDSVYHNLNVNLVSTGGGYTYGVLGMSHHATEDLSILNSIPNITISAPSTNWETKMSFNKLVNTKGTTYLRLEKNASDLIPFERKTYKLGKLIKYRKGDFLAIICIGGIFNECIRAYNNSKANSSRISIYTLSTLKPIDEIHLKNILRKYKFIFTIEENNYIGGLGSTISSIITKYSLKTRLKIFSTNDQTLKIVGDQNYLRKKIGIDYLTISSEIKKVFKSEN